MAAFSRAASTGRVANDSTDNTGRPDTSTASTDTESSPTGVNLARNTPAPRANSRTPPHENGNRTPSPNAPTCNTASN
ncbi:hypothetical protein, partial [Streptomyces sp. NPDC050560]|uniref:hypothetical protein n=1 Tax=Streptomyces sp. NPDC050560 TaxID=3365630 RepID=UPI0037B3F104